MRTECQGKCDAVSGRKLQGNGEDFYTNVMGAIGVQWAGRVRPMRDMGESIRIRCESTRGG
jgi:hypothetical protein